MKLKLNQVGEKYRLRTEQGGSLRQMGPRKLSKNVAEYRLAVLTGEEPYDYVDDPTSPEEAAAIDAAIEKYIASVQRSIDNANTQIASYEQKIAASQAIIDNPDSTEEQKEQAAKNIAIYETSIASYKSMIVTYEDNIKNAASNVNYVTIEEIPEVLTLGDSKCKFTIKGDFAANEITTIQANEKLSKPLTLNNTGNAANLVLDLGNSDAVLSGNWNEISIKSVANLKINSFAHVEKLTISRGNALVNNAYVDDCVTEVVEEGGSVEANAPVEASDVKSFTALPRVVRVNKEINLTQIKLSYSNSGHHVYENNGRVNSDYKDGALQVLGIAKVDFKGQGEWHSNSNPTIWIANVDAVANVYDGKFYNDANEAETIYAEKGTINIYGGEFHNVPKEGAKNYLLNCKDDQYKAGKANIIVYGGKFYEFNPAANGAESSDDSTNFVAEGYKSIFNEEGGYYEVVKDE